MLPSLLWFGWWVEGKWFQHDTAHNMDVSYREQLGHDSWKETLLLSFSHLFVWLFEHHRLSAISVPLYLG